MSSPISIIVPAYNAESTLAETLDSVAGQTLRSGVELIVVDDGSADATAAIAESHPVAPRVIRVENGGAPRAMNIGLKAAHGDYLCFLDADDLWAPEKLERQLAVLERRPELGFVLGFSEAFECPSMPAEAFRSIRYVKGAVPGFLGGTIMARRENFTDRPGLYDETLKTGCFIDWFRRATSAGIRHEMLDLIVLRRRIRPNTLSRRVAGARGAAADALSRDFVEIARRAILEKRKANR